MGRLHYFTGAMRSGKSRHALALANTWGEKPVYIATYQVDPSDTEMADRVQRHQAERTARWRTLEAPEDVVMALQALNPPPSGVMLDCMTLWLSARLDNLSSEAILALWRHTLDYFKASPWPCVVVGNEVGWAPVPNGALLRRFCDMAGWMAQATAEKADEAWVCVAGCPLRLK